MAVNVEKILRGLETEEKIFRGTKRVQTIKAVECIKALSKQGLDAQTIKNEINSLLENYKLVKVRVNEKKTDSVDISISKNLGANDIYMWTEEKFDFITLFIGISVIFCVILWYFFLYFLEFLLFFCRIIALGINCFRDVFKDRVDHLVHE